jgi:hypothetical protein
MDGFGVASTYFAGRGLRVRWVMGLVRFVWVAGGALWVAVELS